MKFDQWLADHPAYRRISCQHSHVMRVEDGNRPVCGVCGPLAEAQETLADAWRVVDSHCR